MSCDDFILTRLIDVKYKGTIWTNDDLGNTFQ